MAQKISPAVLPPLKDALTKAFWYKQDLRSFLMVALSDSPLIPQLDWAAYKRSIVNQLVDTLARSQERHFDELLALILATADITDPSHLKQLDDGASKYSAAVEALDTLRKQVEPYRKLRGEEEAAAQRHRDEAAKNAIRAAVREKLDELRTLFYEIVGQQPQQRGYSLERLVNELFAAFDIDAKASFRVVGEQIDGAFTFEGIEYLFEAKWQNELVGTADLRRKRQHASRTGEIMLGATTILT